MKTLERVTRGSDNSRITFVFSAWFVATFSLQRSRLFSCDYTIKWASLVAQMVKNSPAVQETRVWSLGWEDPLAKGMATLSIILAWRIPGTEAPGGLQSLGSQRVRQDWVTNTYNQILELPRNSWEDYTSSPRLIPYMNVPVFSLLFFIFCKQLQPNYSKLNLGKFSCFSFMLGNMQITA